MKSFAGNRAGPSELSPVKENLKQARSTFLAESLIVSGGNAPVAFMKYLLMVLGWFVIIFSLAFFQTAPIVFEVVILVVGAVTVYVGASGFVLLHALEKLPKVDVSDAKDGLNMIEGTWVAESKPLISPITNTNCVFYQIDLQEWVNAGRASRWESVATYAKGTPGLLADATGYVAFDVEDAGVTLSGGVERYYAIDSEGELALSKTPQGEDLIKYMKSGPFEFDPSTVGVEIGDPTKHEIAFFKGTELSFVERTLPTTSGTAIGKVIDTQKTFDGKPVKAMVYDKRTKLLGFKNETEAAFEHKATVADYAYIAAGIVMLAVGMVLLV